jgi:hypothetical protein
MRQVAESGILLGQRGNHPLPVLSSLLPILYSAIAKNLKKPFDSCENQVKHTSLGKPNNLFQVKYYKITNKYDDL